jgi:hypothetical protein
MRVENSNIRSKSKPDTRSRLSRREVRVEEFKEAALKRGCDELQSRLEWLLRERPRALANARQRYADICISIYVRIERAAKVQRSAAHFPESK